MDISLARQDPGYLGMLADVPFSAVADTVLLPISTAAYVLSLTREPYDIIPVERDNELTHDK
jgi:hypothetical protein